jgi:hypothetical protein
MRIWKRVPQKEKHTGEKYNGRLRFSKGQQFTFPVIGLVLAAIIFIAINDG